MSTEVSTSNGKVSHQCNGKVSQRSLTFWNKIFFFLQAEIQHDYWKKLLKVAYKSLNFLLRTTDGSRTGSHSLIALYILHSWLLLQETKVGTAILGSSLIWIFIFGHIDGQGISLIRALVQFTVTQQEKQTQKLQFNNNIPKHWYFKVWRTHPTQFTNDPNDYHCQTQQTKYKG